jgi:GNAT superfamily N-acetyltransferase
MAEGLRALVGSYVITEVKTLRTALRMRNVRNRVRVFLTHNRKYISVTQQARWYLSEYKPRYLNQTMFAYLMWYKPSFGRSRVIGYGMTRETSPNSWTVTGALLPEGRGLGLGKALFNFLTTKAVEKAGPDGEVWLDVHYDNFIARHLYGTLGYEEVAGPDSTIVVMKLRKPTPFALFGSQRKDLT